MVALGSFSSRVGASSPRRASVGNVGGGKKTIYGAGPGVSNSGTGVSPDGNKLQINTPWASQPKKGWVDRGWGALTGERKQKKSVQLVEGEDKNYREKVGEMKIRFVKNDGKNLKDGMKISYNRRKSKQRIEVRVDENDSKLSRAVFRRRVADKISAEMKKHSRNNSGFQSQQGLSYLSDSQQRMITKDIKGSRAVKTALKRAGSGNLGGAKSSKRGITISGK